MILTVLDKKLKKHEKAWDSTGTDSLNGGAKGFFWTSTKQAPVLPPFPAAKSSKYGSAVPHSMVHKRFFFLNKKHPDAQGTGKKN